MPSSIAKHPSLHTGRLLLVPQDPWQAPALEPLRSALSTIGFLGMALESDTRFALGEDFFHYVGFTGCAVNLQGTQDSVSCQIRLYPPQPEPEFFAGRNTRPPRCPSCRRTLADWFSQRALWTRIRDARLSCPICAHDTPAWHWDWRGQAGFARLRISIEEVFPGEASPLPGLLVQLRDASDGIPWHWFAVQDEPGHGLI